MRSDQQIGTGIAEIFVRVKFCTLALADFRTRKIFILQGRCHMRTLVNVYGFRMLQNFVRSAKSMENTKINCVRKFLQLQCAEPISRYAEIVEIFVRNNIVLFSAVSTIFSMVRELCTSTSVCNTTLAVRKFMAYETLPEYENFK